MTLRELPAEEILRRLSGTGLRLRTGPFTYSIAGDCPGQAKALGTLYADFPLAEEDGFIDFHVRVARRRLPRRPLRALACVEIDGVTRFGPFPSAAAMLNFEWALNWCVSRHAHQYLILHAATMERNGRALLVPGWAGTGKSTLAAVLAVRGWRLLSDEMALVSCADGSATPLARPVCLKNRSIALLKELAPAWPCSAPAEVEGEGQVLHMQPPAESVARMDERAMPAALAFVAHRRDAPTALAPLSKTDAMLQAIPCCFNYKALGEAGFDALTRLVERCPAFRLTYRDAVEAARTVEGLS